jgi:metallophosphoesterase (TIGR03767 family)
MELSRRAVLRSAAVVGGAAAVSPILGSLSEAAVAAGTTTTLTQTWSPGAAGPKGYRPVVLTGGEPWAVRTDLGIEAGEGRAACRQGLLAFAQFSDIHVVDHQSPGRVEWLDRFEDPNDENLVPGLLSSSYRPHEMLTAQVADAMVQAVNAITAAPATGLPLAFMIETGDNSDNCQKNEIRWNIDILDGQQVRPDSGSYSRYEGVMDSNILYYDIHYWHPEGNVLLKPSDKLRADHGFPVVKGLLDAARRPFTAAGLDIPWYTCFGNHDGLIQGNFPAKTTQLSALCTGPVKIITLPPGISQSDVLDALQHNQLDELIASILTLPGVRLVTPDPARKSLSRTQVVQEYFHTSSTPSGHGFTPQNVAEGTAYYSFDQGDFRFVVMDSVNPNGYADGSLDKKQFAWLQDTIGGASDKAVMVFSHHTSTTMSNPLVLTGLDASPRVLGPAVVDYLLSQPQVIAWVNGHTHVNAITAHARTDGSGGFWEINTASHIDWPQQARLIEVADNQDGTLSIFTTIIDHAAGAADYTKQGTTLELAAISRELCANDPQTDLDAHRGPASARNTELLVATPPGLLGASCAPVAARVPVGALA